MIALLLQFTFLDAWRDPLTVPATRVYLHGFGSISVPRTFQLRPGVWNHAGYFDDDAGAYPFLLVAADRSIDRERVTFAFLVRPHRDAGANKAWDGYCILTLHRKDPGDIAPQSYFNGFRWTLGERAADILVWDRAAQVSLQLGMKRGDPALREAVARRMLQSVVINGERLRSHFAAADAFPLREREQLYDTFRRSHRALAARGFAPVEPGRPTHRGDESFAVIEHAAAAGVGRPWLYHLVRIASLPPLEARRASVPGGRKLVLIAWDAPRQRWRRLAGDAVSDAALDAFALERSPLDRRRAHLLHLYELPAYAVPWSEEQWAVHEKEIRALPAEVREASGAGRP
ncbi:MAG: hypothetical protein SFV54_17730 [Bryobacteraceae bacterium]|nr:hypothetical protein [Bryobacteraceae bacterium]